MSLLVLLDQISLPLPGLCKRPSRSLTALRPGALPVTRFFPLAMTPDILLGLTLGGGIGLANAAASYGLYRIARDRSDQVFYSVVLLGLVGRLGVALVLVALVLLLAPVHTYAFVGALLVSVALGLVVETTLIYRGQMQRTTDTASGPPVSQTPSPQTSL